MLHVNFKPEIADHPEKVELAVNFAIKGFRIILGNNGLYYSPIANNPCDPLIELPDVDDGLIASFTYTARICGDWAKTGLYTFADAEAEVEWENTNHNRGQRINIKAKTFAELKAIYIAIRTLEIKPHMSWGEQVAEPASETEGATE